MNSNEEKSFTADEVNKIVEERLSRERKQGSSLAAVKELLKSLKAEGILKGESISELASELMALVSERTAEASAKAPEEGTAPEGSENAPEVKEGEGEDPAVAKFEREQAELKKAYPELDIKALFNDKVFCDFYKSYVAEFGDATLLEVYGAFLKAKSIEESLTLSSKLKRTPSSQRASESIESSLTPTQRAIASKAGMSYKEYAKLLEEIPKRNIKSN